MLSHLPALLNPPRRILIIKDNANNGINALSSPFPALMTSFLVIAVINEEATDLINQKAIGNINGAVTGTLIAPRNPCDRFFILCYTVSVAPLINKPESSSDSTLLIILSISSSEMNEINYFPALTVPILLIFFQLTYFIRSCCSF